MLFFIHRPLFAPSAEWEPALSPANLLTHHEVCRCLVGCNQRKSTVVTVISNPQISACSTKPLIEHLKTGEGTILGQLTCITLKLAVEDMQLQCAGCAVAFIIWRLRVISSLAPKRD